MTDFDPAKDARNLVRHGISLSRASDMAVLAIVPDPRQYGEERFLAYGKLDGLNYCLVFTPRNGKRRPISLKRTHLMEMKRNVANFT